MQQGQILQEATEGQIAQTGNKIGGAFKIGKPIYKEMRLKQFNEIFQRQKAEIKARQKFQLLQPQKMERKSKVKNGSLLL